MCGGQHTPRLKSARSRPESNRDRSCIAHNCILVATHSSDRCPLYSPFERIARGRVKVPTCHIMSLGRTFCPARLVIFKRPRSRIFMIKIEGPIRPQTSLLAVSSLMYRGEAHEDLQLHFVYYINRFPSITSKRNVGRVMEYGWTVDDGVVVKS